MCVVVGAGSGSNAHFREEDFSKRAVSINKYVVENKELQLRVLYALQISVAKLKHPPGIYMYIQQFELVMYSTCTVHACCTALS